MADAIVFHWEVNRAGHEIVEVANKPGRFITKRSPVKETSCQRQMAGWGLFQTFAEVESTEAGVLEFADQFGLLGDRRFTEALGRDPLEPHRRRQGEVFSAWQREIAEMHRVTTLWNRANANDSEWLSKHLIFEGDLVAYPSPVGGVNPLLHVSSADTVTLKEVGPLEPGDLIKPARALVARMVDHHLKQSAAPRLFFGSKTKSGQGITHLRFVPNNFLGALWLQFAQAVAQDDRYFVCEVCGAWYVAKRMQGSKPMRHYCPGSACKSKAQRQRRATQATTAELPQSR